MATDETRIDEIVDGIYRISTWQQPYGFTFTTRSRRREGEGEGVIRVS